MKILNWEKFNENYNALMGIREFMNKKLLGYYIVDYKEGPVGVVNIFLSKEPYKDGDDVRNLETVALQYFSAGADKTADPNAKGEWHFVNDDMRFNKTTEDDVILDEIAQMAEEAFN